MRVSSVMAPAASRGTLKSTRTKTRFPPTSTSSMVFLATLQSLAGNVDGQVADAAGVAPLVVVPGDDLDHIADHERIQGAHDSRVRVALEVHRDQRLFSVGHDPLQRSLRRLLERCVDLLDANLA